jgi:RNA polymerase sigma-70 factor (ECF subfamily)
MNRGWSKALKAFDEIYKLYANDVFKYLICLTADENLAEELTQETFFKAYRNIDGFEGKCKMSVWLCQIAKNSYYTYIKKEKSKSGEIIDENIISEINVQEEYIQGHDVLTLHKILHGLEEPYKEVFTLKHFGELSYAQISEIFGKSESWARVTYYRAKEKIKAIFNEKEGLR